MDVLVPIDGSDCSMRAVAFAAELAERFDADLHVVHFSDRETDATDEVLARARETLESASVAVDPELLIDEDLDVRPAGKIGQNILELVEQHGYDHVVMGHQGVSSVERAILGSAAETVLEELPIPVTVVP